ncbi:hypothetical protein DFAR_930005 [Desulfarculales bacterium]
MIMSASLASEPLEVKHPTGDYESAGVVRGMFQNHMMQLLSLCALEPLSFFVAEMVRDEKTKIFGALRPSPAQNRYERLVLGQCGGPPIAHPHLCYDAGLPRQLVLAGGAFFLFSGKRVAATATRIVILFKEVPHSLLRWVLDVGSVSSGPPIPRDVGHLG